MNATEEVLLEVTIFLANEISWYLFRTNRVLKAIELSKEQLFLHDHKSLKNAEKELVVSAKLRAYSLGTLVPTRLGLLSILAESFWTY